MLLQNFDFAGSFQAACEQPGGETPVPLWQSRAEVQCPQGKKDPEIHFSQEGRDWAEGGLSSWLCLCWAHHSSIYLPFLITFPAYLFCPGCPPSSAAPGLERAPCLAGASEHSWDSLNKWITRSACHNYTLNSLHGRDFPFTFSQQTLLPGTTGWKNWSFWLFSPNALGRFDSLQVFFKK